ncbi:hypothetical protein AB0H37_44875, partial [Actinomadura sp. NPDC023710]|uniref:hypothetical protein n=1 Tax=Actinomadura sp. NPDC023710 TaxID=3158219 RepID=UPI0033C6868B
MSTVDDGIGKDRVEQVGEFAVPVADQELCPATRVLQVHDQVPHRLRHPHRGRMSGGAQDSDAAGVVLDDRQHVHAGAGEGHSLARHRSRSRLGRLGSPTLHRLLTALAGSRTRQNICPVDHQTVPWPSMNGAASRWHGQ